MERVHSKAKQALWVDLEALENDGRSYLFRVVTQAHPWGFSKTPLNNKSKVLSAVKSREAMRVFRKVDGYEEKMPHELDIRHVMPWDATAPIPVPLLIESIQKHKGNIEAVCNDLLESLKKSLLWENVLCSKVEHILTNPSEKFTCLVNSLSNALENAEIPALILTQHIGATETGNNEADEKQAIYNLFKRINTGGTTLSREDINYSMLKSVWPEARKVIEDDLLGDLKLKLAQPARMVSIMTRLVLMREKKEIEGLQAELSIAQFKNEINKDLGKKLEEYCEGRGKVVLSNVWNLLTKGDDALPVILASQISHQADDLVLLLMYWLDLLADNDFDKIEKNKVLGFITAVAWFSPNQKKCSILLCKELVKIKSNKSRLINFFNQEQFAKILKLTDKKNILMPPLPDPEKLKQALLSPWKLENNESDLWGKRDLWDHYGGDNTPEDIIEFSKKHMGIKDVEDDQKAKDAWWSFLHQVCKGTERKILLYAQREHMKLWFSWFDPTQPDQIKGHNRPWDYDHILPHSWSNHDTKMRSDVPHLVRIWVNTNGNFRAWPLELNRSKGDSEIIENYIPEYKLKDKKDVCEASFIKNGDDWSKLDDQTKEGFNKKANKKYRKYFVEAAIQRNIDIYTEWHGKLRIESLMQNEFDN